MDEDFLLPSCEYAGNSCYSFTGRYGRCAQRNVAADPYDACAAKVGIYRAIGIQRSLHSASFAVMPRGRLIRLEILYEMMAVAAHNSVCSLNIGVLRRPSNRGRHAYDPVRNGFSSLLPVSASGLSGTGGAGSETSGGCSPSAEARPSVAWSRRPPAVGLALPNLAALPESDGAGQAVNRDPLAPARIPQILALALTLAPCRAAGSESRDS